MKKVLPALVLISLLGIPFIASAQVETIPECMCTEVSHSFSRITDCKPGVTTCAEDTGYAIEAGALCCLLDLIETIVDYAFVILLVVAGFIIVLAAFQFATASGAPEKVNAARDKLIWALVGVVVAFLAKGLASLVEMILT